MAQGHHKNKVHNSVSGRYYMPESMPLVLCGACLIIALEYSKKAKDIYNQIVESYRLPDIHVLKKFEQHRQIKSTQYKIMIINRPYTLR